MKNGLMRFILVLVLITCCINPAIADPNGKPITVPQLTVRGEAVLHVPADQMRLSMGVVTAAVTADAALAENTEKMNDVEKALAGLGLTKDEYRTGQFQVQPQWEPRPRQPVAEWKPRIVGYTVTNTLKITTRKIERAGEIIEAGVKAGANDVGTISFELASPRNSRDEAIKAATANARADALSLSEAASVRLVRILSAQLDEAVARPLIVRMDSFSESALARAESAPGITPGDIAVRASVTLTYQIGQGGEEK